VFFINIFLFLWRIKEKITYFLGFEKHSLKICQSISLHISKFYHRTHRESFKEKALWYLEVFLQKIGEIREICG